MLNDFLKHVSGGLLFSSDGSHKVADMLFELPPKTNDSENYFIVSLLTQTNQSIALELSLLLAQGTHVPLPVTLHLSEINALLNYLKPNIIVCGHPSLLKKAQRTAYVQETKAIVILYNNFIQSLKPIQSKGIATDDIHQHRIAAGIISSGSSGKRKLVFHTLENIAEAYTTFSKYPFFEEGKTYLHLLPFHFSASRKMLYSALVAGMRVVLPGPHLSVVQAIERFQPSLTAVVPSQLQPLGLHLKEAGLSSIQVVCGGAYVSTTIVNKFLRNRWTIIPVYGLTETCSLGTVHTGAPHKPLNAGYPVAGLEVKTDAEGQILLRGKSVAARAYTISEGAAVSLQDGQGWYATGDTGYLDGDGWLYVTGRIENRFTDMQGHRIQPEVLEHWVMERFDVQDAIYLPCGHQYVLVLAAHSASTIEHVPVSIKQTLLDSPPSTLFTIHAYSILPDISPYLTDSGKINRHKLRQAISEQKLTLHPW